VNNIDYSDSIVIECDKKYKLYWVWVKPYNSISLFKGKTGFSESHPKGKYPDSGILNKYDYIVISNKLKTIDIYIVGNHMK